MFTPYIEGGLGTSVESAELLVKTDAIDLLKVFVYNNLSKIISPNPLLILPPGTKSVLEGYINYLPGGFLPKDIQEVFDAFVLTNLNSISQPATPVIGKTPVNK